MKKNKNEEGLNANAALLCKQKVSVYSWFSFSNKTSVKFKQYFLEQGICIPFEE